MTAPHDTREEGQAPDIAPRQAKHPAPSRAARLSPAGHHPASAGEGGHPKRAEDGRTSSASLDSPAQAGEGGHMRRAEDGHQISASLDIPAQAGDTGHSQDAGNGQQARARVNEPAQAAEGADVPAPKTANPEAPPRPSPRKGRGKAVVAAPETARQWAPSRNSSSVLEDTGETVHSEGADTGLPASDRFADPFIAVIREVWRQRQDMVRAQQKLTLQSKAILRRFTAGDKGEAERLWKAITTGTEHPLAATAAQAIAPLRAASEPLEEARHRYELELGRLGKRLPIAHMADRIKGINHGTLARIVAEVGDFTAYEKGVSGIWKRAGLAVIDGERQRKKADKEAAIRHGYSPERHAVFWNVSQALLKAQGTGEAAGPYRLVYDRRKEHELARAMPAYIAHARATRYMVKRLLRDLWREWRDLAKARVHDVKIAAE